MAELLALAAAVCFGLTHFFSGLLARRAGSAAVALVGQVGGTVLILAVAPFVAAPFVATPSVAVPALAWGCLSGLGTGIGVMFLYRGLSRGQMSAVVPLSDVGAVALPVLVGVALLGDRPSVLAWAGIAAALPALWLVSRSGSATPEATTASGTLDGLVAGAGFAMQFVALAQADPAAGLWPVAAARLASVGMILALARASGAALRLPGRLVLPAALVGSVGTAAIVLYVLATRQQLLSLAVVLSALYPAIPVLLGITALRERPSKRQIAGLFAAGAAIGLIAAG